MDWKRIKAEYIAGGTSYRKLAEKYSVPFGTLRRVAEREGWTQKRTQVEHKTDTKMIETISDDAAEKAVNINDIANKLLGKIEEIAEMVSDPDSIKKLTSAIKDLKEIKGIKSDADMREQEARIRNLQRQAEADNTSKDIEVQFGSEAEEYSR